MNGMDRKIGGWVDGLRRRMDRWMDGWVRIRWLCGWMAD